MSKFGDIHHAGERIPDKAGLYLAFVVDLRDLAGFWDTVEWVPFNHGLRRWEATARWSHETHEVTHWRHLPAPIPAEQLTRQRGKLTKAERKQLARTLEFQECATCRAKPGTPALCAGCLHNRSVIDTLKEACHNRRVVPQER